MICRSATHYLRLGFVKGYRCQTCGAELQASPVGVEQIEAGGIPVCVLCGTQEAERGDEAKARRRRGV